MGILQAIIRLGRGRGKQEQPCTLASIIEKAGAEYERKGKPRRGVTIYTHNLPQELEPYVFLELKSRWGKARMIAMYADPVAKKGWMVRVRFIEEENESP
jgi:hypothetical protein